jgi:hypothetical protein
MVPIFLPSIDVVALWLKHKFDLISTTWRHILHAQVSTLTRGNARAMDVHCKHLQVCYRQLAPYNKKKNSIPLSNQVTLCDLSFAPSPVNKRCG